MIQKVQIDNAPQPNNCKSANSGVGKVHRVICFLLRRPQRYHIEYYYLIKLEFNAKAYNK